MFQPLISIKTSLFIRVVVLCLWAAGPTLAEGLLEPAKADVAAGSTAPTMSEPSSPTGHSVESLMARLTAAEERLDQARAHQGATLKSLRMARKRNYPRGPALQHLRLEASRSEVERDAAEQAFLSDVEQARREGLPAGLLSSFLDRAEQIQSSRDARVSGRMSENSLPR